LAAGSHRTLQRHTGGALTGNAIRPTSDNVFRDVDAGEMMRGMLWARMGTVGALPLALLMMGGYAAEPAWAGAPPPAVVVPVAPQPTPSCEEWQTVTQVPVSPPPSRAGDGPSRSARPTAPMISVCRNAPPTPFKAPRWDPETVVGGARLVEPGVVVDLSAAVPAPPEVLDVSYVLADLDTGEILAAKAPHAWLRPASTLKTLTALTLLPRLDPKAVVTATDEHVGANGTRAGMIAGNPYPVASLFEAMLMQSANDAAYGLADAAGGYDKTLGLMNAVAKEIGAHDTLALDPSGLDEPGQRSSAYDLALIGRAAMRLPQFREHITKRDAVFPGGTDARTGTTYDPFHIPNINALLWNYDGAIGIKPGRTNRAQHTFIGAATRGDRTLIVTQLGSTSGSWEPTAALLDWGFAHADDVSPVGRLVEPGEAAPPREQAASVPGAPTTDTGTPGPLPAAAGQAVSAQEGNDPAPTATVVAVAVSGLGLLLLWGTRRRRS
jgi:D-alanyl-D-alanine carboxypeptidase (penicillin-binding protein 5/6)